MCVCVCICFWLQYYFDEFKTQSIDLRIVNEIIKVISLKSLRRRASFDDQAVVSFGFFVYQYCLLWNWVLFSSFELTNTEYVLVVCSWTFTNENELKNAGTFYANKREIIAFNCEFFSEFVKCIIAIIDW